VKWIIEEVEDEREDMRSFTVRRPEQKTFLATYVWWDGRRAWCCKCSGNSAAMLSSCYHAKAVKRFAMKEQS